MLFRSNYDIIHAWNGKEAVEMYEEFKPDVILMDLNMPIVNGYEATKLIHEKSWSVPIIALTAYTFANEEDKVLESGFDAYLTKPIDIQKLNDTIIEQKNK